MNPKSPCLGVNRHQTDNSPRTGPGRSRGPRPPWPRRARAAAVVTVMAPAALLVVACGGSPSSAGSGGSPDAGGSANAGRVPVAYSRCVRSHGIPNFPDPNSSGQIPKEEIVQLGVSSSRLQAAQAACQRLWPFQAPSQAQQRQQLAGDLKFAQCMRAHGLPKFPDPTNSGGHVEFVFNISADGFDPHSPQVLAKAHECLHVLPAGTTQLPQATVSP